MLTNIPLSKYKIGQTFTLHARGYKQNEIARIVGCIEGNASKYMRSKPCFGIKIKPLGRTNVTSHTERKIVILAATGKYSIREIQRELAKNLSKDSIHRVLMQNPNMKFRKKFTRLPLTCRHKTERLNFAKGTGRKLLLVTKTLYLDVYLFYWQDLQKCNQMFFKRQLSKFQHL